MSRCRRRKRPTTPVVLGCLLALACQDDPRRHPGNQSGSPATESPPWVVLLVIDSLRADFVGAYGFDGSLTPRIDELASRSILFENAYSVAPWTKPSVASLLTSLSPETHGVLDHDGRFDDSGGARHVVDGLAPEAHTLAEGLAAAGYRTTALVANPWLRKTLGFAQGFDDFIRTPPARSAELVDRLGEQLDALDPAQPHFLYIHLMDAHGPYDAPAADFEAASSMAGIGPKRALTAAERSAVPPYLRAGSWVAGAAGKDLARWRAAYAAGVRAADRTVGAILDALEARGLLEHAVLVVTSDHGEELAEHGGWDHGHTLYEEQLRIPLLLRLPGDESGGRRPGAPVSLLDVMPTLLAIAGAPTSSGLLGRDLRDPAPVDGAPPLLVSGVKSRTGLHAIQSGRHKFVFDEDGGVGRLYDRQADPAERRDLSRQRPETRTTLERQLARLRADAARDRFGDAPRVPLDPALAVRLEALGYLGEDPPNEERATRR